MEALVEADEVAGLDGRLHAALQGGAEPRVLPPQPRDEISLGPRGCEPSSRKTVSQIVHSQAPEIFHRVLFLLFFLFLLFLLVLISLHLGLFLFLILVFHRCGRPCLKGRGGPLR